MALLCGDCKAKLRSRIAARGEDCKFSKDATGFGSSPADSQEGSGDRTGNSRLGSVNVGIAVGSGSVSANKDGH